MYLKAILTLVLSFNAYAQAGFQFDRVPVEPDGNYLHPAFDQRLVEFRRLGVLAADVILKLRNAADLLVPRGRKKQIRTNFDLRNSSALFRLVTPAGIEPTPSP